MGGQNVMVTESGWALPEAAPPPGESGPGLDAAALAPMPGSNGAAGRTAAPPVPVLPVFERPLTVADVLDGAFQVIKARPRHIVTIAALFVVPVGLLVAFADVGVLGGDVVSTLTDPETYEENSTAAEGDFGITVISTLVSSALITLMAAPIARLVEAWYLRRDPSVAEVVRGLGWGWLSIAVGYLLVHVVEAVGTVLLLLPGLVAMVLLLVTAPVIAVERIGPLAGMRRSFQLTRRRFWSTLWIALLAALVANTLGFLLPLVPLAVTGLFGFGGEQYVVAAGTIASSLLTLPFVAAAAVMTYFDLRVRTEGLDLQMALHDHFEVVGSGPTTSATRDAQ